MFVDPQQKSTSGWNHLVRTQDAGGIIPKNKVKTLSWVFKSRRLINDQVLGKILYNNMSISNKEASIGREIESYNARDGTLSGFFSYGSTNRLRRSRASSLATLRAGWEEHLLHFCFTSIGTRSLLCFSYD